MRHWVPLLLAAGFVSGCPSSRRPADQAGPADASPVVDAGRGTSVASEAGPQHASPDAGPEDLADAGTPTDAAGLDADAPEVPPALVLSHYSHGGQELYLSRAPDFPTPQRLTPERGARTVAGRPLAYSPDDAKLAVFVPSAHGGEPGDLFVAFPCRQADCPADPRADWIARLRRPKVEFSPGSDGLLLHDDLSYGSGAWYYAAVEGGQAHEARPIADEALQVRFVGEGRALLVVDHDGVTLVDLARFAAGKEGARIQLGPHGYPNNAHIGPVSPDGSRFWVWDAHHAVEGARPTLHEVDGVLAGELDGTPVELSEPPSAPHVSDERVVVHHDDDVYAHLWDGTDPIALGIGDGQQSQGCGDYLLASQDPEQPAERSPLVVLQLPDATGEPSTPNLVPLVGVTWNRAEQDSLSMNCLDAETAILRDGDDSGDAILHLAAATAHPLHGWRRATRESFSTDYSLLVRGGGICSLSRCYPRTVNDVVGGEELWSSMSLRRSNLYHWARRAPWLLTDAALTGTRQPGLHRLDFSVREAGATTRIRDEVFEAELGALSSDDRHVAYGARSAYLAGVPPIASGTFEMDLRTGETRQLGPVVSRPVPGVQQFAVLGRTRTLLAQGQFEASTLSELLRCELDAPKPKCERVLETELGERLLKQGLIASNDPPYVVWPLDTAEGRHLAVLSQASLPGQPLQLVVLAQPLSTDQAIPTARGGLVGLGNGRRVYHFDVGTGAVTELDPRELAPGDGVATHDPPGSVLAIRATGAGRILIARADLPGDSLVAIEPDALARAHTLVEPIEGQFVNFQVLGDSEWLWIRTYSDSEADTARLSNLETGEGGALGEALAASPCVLRPDHSAVLLRGTDGKLSRVELRPLPAAGQVYSGTVVAEADAYCDERPVHRGRMANQTHFVFRQSRDAMLAAWDGNSPPVALSAANGAATEDAVFSPDGRHLLARSRHDGGWYRWQADALQAPPVRLADSELADDLPHFDPSGRYVVLGGEPGTWAYDLEAPDEVHRVSSARLTATWVP